MNNRGINPGVFAAWLAARSMARGLPSPVSDRGGFRVDTDSAVEIARWVFTKSSDALTQLAHDISSPGYLLKLCGPADDLQAALPSGWTIHAPGYFMKAAVLPQSGRLPDGYRIDIRQNGVVSEVSIFSQQGALAANGYAAETNGVFVYDRIVTAPDHRRKGLGRVLMLALHDTRQHSGSTELLVATEDDRALYAALGWQTISPFSTASFIGS